MQQMFTCVASGTRTAYSSGAPELTLGLKWVRVARSLVSLVMFCRSTSHSSVAIFQLHQRMEFTFQTVILELAPKYIDFVETAQLLTQKLLKQGYLSL